MSRPRHAVRGCGAEQMWADPTGCAMLEGRLEDSRPSRRTSDSMISTISSHTAARETHHQPRHRQQMDILYCAPSSQGPEETPNLTHGGLRSPVCLIDCGLPSSRLIRSLLAVTSMPNTSHSGEFVAVVSSPDNPKHIRIANLSCPVCHNVSAQAV